MRLALLLASVALALPAAALAQSAAPAVQPVADYNAQLLKLFHDSDEAQLKLNPLSAIFRGDMRYADRLGDFGSDAYYNASRAAAESDLRNLHAIPRDKLTPTNQIAYDVFEWQTNDTLKGLSPEILALTAVRPIDHFFGFHVFYPTFASGQGAAPFKTVADYENNLKRHRDYIALLDRSIARFRQGMKTGVVQPKLVVNNVIDQLDTQIKQGVEGSTFYQPVTKFPEGISAADQARLKSEYAAAIRDGILPADIRLRDFLKNEYLPVARDGEGLKYMPGGDKLYAYLIESNTTLPMTAEYVHNLGLSEVARIKGEMEAIKTQVGFKGTLPEFFEYLRTDPKFQPASREAYTQLFYDIGKRVDARVREQFSTIPKTPLEIRPYEEYREKTQAGGSYESGSPDGKRPGVFYFNAYDLPSRRVWGAETLFLHEGIPGHHFQISLAQENTALPAFMRFGGNTAYAEGWGLYAETLWKQLGMETDPYQRFGGLNDEMLRAMRLVVDTGIHWKGWHRDQAIDYMLANSGMSRTEATAEVERYIAIPGQALAYKIGALTIQRLKAKAMKELGPKFDPREFHAQVLMTGALPMEVLEKKIDTWIAAKKAA
ncbi:hypothetical protein SCH01S_45_00680 [Sphingomonas changbaiensis NBRC 104936]|uniref:DUF885 domain-containing protein n=1 Tax=Sphingomonas changbaiensis NBRC 104936 TaxID=1219043 RepID=A0A0E9MSW5_9SPHN|nr:DUF885 domain-containing protein [Sphingomonas changbaiensis]GAO40225.1 hypothetical protein SCH01S_45_00680 [Sphingomonas changbaiensis NBRC 104936]